MLNLFINTWGNYNENGADGGEWITLPMEDDELEEALERIAKNMGDQDPEFCIHDYEWTSDFEGDAISEHDSIEELNELCQRLAGLSEYEAKVYAAAVEIWGSKYVDLDSLDDYQLLEGINDNYDLGYYWAVDSGCYDLSNMGHLASYFDYEAFGRDIEIETDGGFTTYGFIERS